MHQVVAWLNRLRDAEPSNAKLTERYFRIVVPSSTPLKIDNCLIAATPIGPLPPFPGDGGPKAVSVLRIPDTDTVNRSIEVDRQLTSEIASILTLVTDRRIDIPPEIALRVEGQSEVTFIGYGAAIDRRLIGPIESQIVEPFHTYLSRLASLAEPHLTAIGSACMLHHGAVLLFEQDVRSAYLLLIAGIEVLSRQYGSPPLDWKEWDESTEWDRFFGTIDVTSEVVNKLKEKLLTNKHLRLKATFRLYASERLPDSFWDEPWKEWECVVDASKGCWGDPKPRAEEKLGDMLQADRGLLSKSLGLSYDLRSGLVHRGTRLELMTAVRMHNSLIAKPRILPFAILRSIFLALIREEIAQHATASPLPGLRAFG